MFSRKGWIGRKRGQKGINGGGGASGGRLGRECSEKGVRTEIPE